MARAMRLMGTASRRSQLGVWSWVGAVGVPAKMSILRQASLTKRQKKMMPTIAISMAVADQAFGYAVNSIRRPNVASQFNIHFIAPARAGDELTAEGKVVRSGRRVSIAEMTVTNQEGKLIAKATGTTIPLENNPS